MFNRMIIFLILAVEVIEISQVMVPLELLWISLEPLSKELHVVELLCVFFLSHRVFLFFKRNGMSICVFDDEKSSGQVCRS